MLREHMDATMEIGNIIKPMDRTKITVEDLKKQLKKTKDKKCPGPDGIRPELMKALSGSDVCMKHLANCYNAILEDGIRGTNWEFSITKLQPKISKPTVKDLRPIALTDVPYKIFMGIMKDKIENHLKINNITQDLQAGFTKGKRITDNLYMLKHTVERSFNTNQPLIVTSVDFQKAFDSVSRKRLLQALKDAKVDALIINIIAEIYTQDKTDLYINNEKKAELPVQSGIRQGCNGSTVLFLLITYLIIDELQKSELGYTDNIIKIASLFFADDGLLLARNLLNAEREIQLIIRVAANCGMRLNKEKSKILIFNMIEQPNDIQEIKVVTELKYLGVKITNKRNCFERHKKESLEKAKKYATMIHSVIARCCNRIMIGKTYWKSLAMPSFLFGSEVIEYSEGDLQALQKVENQVYRGILKTPTYVASCTLRAEIGASSARARDIKSKLLFAKHATSENAGELLKETFLFHYNHSETSYIQLVQRYMSVLDISLNKLKFMTEMDIKKTVNNWDHERWQN